MRAVIAQEPGAAKSDDRVFQTGNAVVMLDGASAFAPIPVPAAVYVDHLGDYLQQQLSDEPHADLRSVLSAGIAQTTRDLNLRPRWAPSSTVTIVRQAADRIDVLVLGDNTVMMPDQLITDSRLDRVAAELHERYRRRLAAGHGYDDQHRALLAELQHHQAQARNQAGGYWIAEAEPDAAEHAIVATRSRLEVPWAILATDGAYDTMKHLGLADANQLAKASASDLVEILSTCQTWEALADPAAQQFPRAKRHDDKSLAVLTFES